MQYREKMGSITFGEKDNGVSYIMEKERFKMIIEMLDFDKLSDWEEEFLISVEEQFKTKNYLSERQEEIVEQIFRKRND